MYLTIHRGTNEIGGSCIELATNSSKVLIDIGLPLDFNLKTKEQQQLIKLQVQNWCVDVDAIFISHYHQDHHGLLSEVSLEMPVFVTRGTASMFNINSVFLPNKTKFDNVQIIKPATTSLPAIPVTIGDIKITAFTVDHSAYDACAYLIEADGKKILYSGDIRLHGRKGILYKNFPQDVDFLILEGTNIEKSNTSKTECDIEQEFVKLFKNKDGKLNFVWCSGQNIDRLTNIFKATIKTHKILVVDVYIAAVLYEIHKLNDKIPSPESHGIKVWYTHPIKYSIGETNYSLLFPNQRIRPIEIINNPENYVVVMRPSMLRFIQQNLKVSKANVITSLWKEYEKGEKRFFNWVDLQGYKKLHIHTSGHADMQSLKTIADYINPKEIIPIHTLKKDFFETVFRQKIKLLEDNESYNI